MPPNPLQQQAIDGLRDFILQGPEAGWCAFLEGPAGSGKTFTVANVILETQKALAENKQQRLILVAAPTHKAKKVLVNALSRYGITVEATTVSALIGKAPAADEEPDEEGKAKWRRNDNGGLKPNSILVVDEVSMVGITDAKALQKTIKVTNSQVLFVGDFSQLRPVKDASIYENMEKVPVRYKLNEVMRSGNPGIVGMSKAVRLTGRLDDACFDGESVFRYNDSRDFERKFAEMDGAVAVAYTNRRVAELNRIKRQTIYRTANPAAFMPDEKVILTEAPFFVRRMVNGRWAPIKMADNNDVLIVEHCGQMVSKENAFSDVAVRYYDLMVRNEETGVSFPVSGLTYDMYENTLKPVMEEVLTALRSFSAKLYKLSKDEDTKDSANQSCFTKQEQSWLDTVARKADRVRTTTDSSGRVFELGTKASSWGDVAKFAWATLYFGFRNEFAVLLYEHASTAHKAQGSTYQHVFVDWPNIETIRDPDDRQSAAYVAVSRASETLHIRV